MFDPIAIIESVGYYGVLAIIFAECGLFFGFFLPGDSLLFAAGFLASKGFLDITALVIFGIFSAILGENVGYAFGRKFGPMLFKKERSRFFKPEYVLRAHEFFVHHGNKAIFLARFAPIIRTFVPIVAGVARMPFQKFMMYNIIGAVVWIGSMTLLGYALGSRVANADHFIQPLMLGIIVISFIPAYLEWRKAKKHR